MESRGARRRVPQPPSRLPAPVRERRPALAALAVLLILGGALASGLVALRSGERADYLVLRSDVDPGDQIGPEDLGVARIAGTGANAIAAEQRAQVVGQYARTKLFDGTLLTADMLSPRPTVPAGAAVVGMVLTPERRPAGRLAPGDVVAVYTVPRPDEPGGQATQLLSAVEVVEVDEVSTGGGSAVAVSLLVPEADAQELALRSTLGQLAVAKLSPGSTPLVSSVDAG
jgi:Flp pilus assembly protein CpaB